MSDKEFEKNLDNLVELAKTGDETFLSREVEEWKEERDAEMKALALKIRDEQATISELQTKLKERKKALKKMLSDIQELALAEPPKPSEKMEINIECADEGWLKNPVSELEGLTENQIEKLSERFKTIGEVVEWVGDDFSEKIPGIGEAVKDKIRESVNIAAGVTDDKIREVAEAEKAKRLNSEIEVEENPYRVEAFRFRCLNILDEVDDPEFDDQYVRDVLAKVENDKFYTADQLEGIENVERVFLDNC